VTARWATVSIALALAACSGASERLDGAGQVANDGGPRGDAGSGADGSSRADAGFGADAVPGVDGGFGADAAAVADANPERVPVQERAQALGAAIYIHPTDPLTPSRALDGYTGLRRATWEWGFETGSHALRLVFGGLFDRFPRAKIILGHLGETLPYLLWRFDSRAKLYGVKLTKPPSQYVKDNFMVTTSGMCSAEPLACAISALGHDRVMFAADYPFESTSEAAHFIDNVSLDEKVRSDICCYTAARVLKLPS